jgi:hypothetical protein
MKIITVKSRTLLLLTVALLLLVFLLPSCTVQKRLYRPGFYVETHAAEKKQPERKMVSAVTVQQEERHAENAAGLTAVLKTESDSASIGVQPARKEEPVVAVAPVKHIDSAGKKKSVMKQLVAAPKKLRKLVAKKQAWSNAKNTDSKGNIIRIIAGVLILIGLVIISIIIGDPLLIPKVLLIGSVVFFVIIGVAALCLLIYILNWLVDFVEGGCGL